MSIVPIIVVAASVAILNSDALAIVPHGGNPTPAAQVNSPVHADGDFQTTMAFGAAAVCLMVFCRMNQEYRSWMAIGTFVFGILAAGYAFVAGTWPLGLAVGGYSIACLCRYINSRPPRRKPIEVRPRRQIQHQPWEESRMSRMFG